MRPQTTRPVPHPIPLPSSNAGRSIGTLDLDVHAPAHRRAGDPRGRFTAGVAPSPSIATSLRSRAWRSGWTSRVSTPGRRSETIKSARRSFSTSLGFREPDSRAPRLRTRTSGSCVGGFLDLHGVRHPVEMEVTLGPVTRQGDVARASYEARASIVRPSGCTGIRIWMWAVSSSAIASSCGRASRRNGCQTASNQRTTDDSPGTATA